jgi:hypothetical protein
MKAGIGKNSSLYLQNVVDVLLFQSIIRQAKDACKATNECFYGMGPGSETETG